MAAKLTEEQMKEYMAGLVAKAKAAQKSFERNYKDQRSVDEVVRAVGMAIKEHGRELSEQAVKSTGMGNVETKIAKNNGVALGIWNFVKGKTSVGCLGEVPGEPGVKVYAKPMGVIGCVMPSTNPIATIIGNAMVALKGRNAVIIASHPASVDVSLSTVDYMRQAIKAIGAPEDLIQCIGAEESSIEATAEMLKQCDANVATGGAAMVKSVYSSGKPGFGVGQGNCQSLIDDYEDMDYIAETIVNDRFRDYGIPCGAEQFAHVPAEREEEFLKSMQAKDAFLLEGEEIKNAFRELVFPGGNPSINRKIVGKSVQIIGEMLGIQVPEEKKVFVMKVQASGAEDLLCKEILCPIVRYETYTKFEDAVEMALNNLENEGAGHSGAIWTTNQAHVDYAADILPLGRFHINQATVGTNNGVAPSATIGCGTWGNNSISENLQYYHLLNKTRVTVQLTNKKVPTDADWDDFNEYNPCEQ